MYQWQLGKGTKLSSERSRSKQARRACMHGRTHTWVGPVDTHIIFLSSLSLSWPLPMENFAPIG
jgi:hypothetical protein